MNALQLRLARTALNLTIRQAAELAAVSHETIVGMEAARASVKSSTVAKVRAALEAAGVIFVEENGEGPGVRLKKQTPAVAELTEKIHALDDKIAAIDVDGEPSPELGMNRSKRRSSKTSGRS
jgi:transcriptional regulator with XRE-family HTH domain